MLTWTHHKYIKRGSGSRGWLQERKKKKILNVSKKKKYYKNLCPRFEIQLLFSPTH